MWKKYLVTIVLISIIHLLGTYNVFGNQKKNPGILDPKNK